MPSCHLLSWSGEPFQGQTRAILLLTSAPRRNRQILLKAQIIKHLHGLSCPRPGCLLDAQTRAGDQLARLWRICEIKWIEYFHSLDSCHSVGSFGPRPEELYLVIRC